MGLQRVGHDWATELNWTELNNELCWAFFMSLLAISMASLEKCLFSSFPTFWLGCLFSWYWVVWAACIFWTLILCQLFQLLYFLSLWGLSFHLAYSFLCCAKVSKFNQVPLVYFGLYFHYSRRWVGHRGSCFGLCHWVFCLCFPLRVLKFLVLHLGL